MTFCSTDEAVTQTGATYRQLDHWVRRGFLTPATSATSGEGRPGKHSYRRWSPTDLAAAGAVAEVISAGTGDRSEDLARLVALAVYVWHGRAPWVVVALPDVVEPAIDAVDVAGIVERLPVATVIPL